MGLESPPPTPDFSLLEILADGSFHSGETLGAMLGVSRAAVWKQLQTLAGLGLDVERVRGKGYRLAGAVSLLDERDIRAAGNGLPHLDIDVRRITGSTNEDALVAARGVLSRPLAVLAEVQVKGRGRQGRPWHTSLGGSLALSVVVEFPGGASSLEGMSLAVGVVVARVLREQAGVEVGLKWPNDLYVRERKLGGILIELAGDLDSSCRPVIGIGLNCASSEAFGASVDQPWTSILAESGQSPDRNRLAGVLLQSLMEAVELFRQKGFQPFRDEWRQYDVLEGKAVRVTRGQTGVEGLAAGVSERGSLLLECQGRVSEYAGGEVSVRPAATGGS